MSDRGRTAAGLLLVALLLVAITYGCHTPDPQLTDAETVALQAVVEASMRAPKAPLCITTSPDAADSSGQQNAKLTSKDPSEHLQAAFLRLGNVYRSEQCPANGLQVILGPVELASGGERAHLKVWSTFGELSGELRVMSFQRVQDGWTLQRSTLLIQE